MDITVDTLLEKFPHSLHFHLENYWQKFIDAGNADLSAETIAQLLHAWLASDFFAKHCLSQPEDFAQLLASGDLEVQNSFDDYQHKAEFFFTQVDSETSLKRQLRKFRNREMMRILWRDVNGLSILAETLNDLSALADVCINLCLNQLYVWQCEKYGIPYDEQGKQQFLLVVALGKLGTKELNFSSDVDLMFVYPAVGTTQGDKQISNEQFFLRLSQSLIYCLHEVTADGFVFRVDMRLRPFGDSGALVMTTSAIELYYSRHGRGWERYALVKARVISGDVEAAAELTKLLRAFVYRRYVDYGAVESLRELKSLLKQEAIEAERGNDIKRGIGGIREVEFIVQVLQLIRGGQDKKLQHRNVTTALAYLAQRNYLVQTVADELTKGYAFLRVLENRLQMLDDQQTHCLPQDEFSKTRIAFSMGYSQWADLFAQLKKHREYISQFFLQMIAPPESEANSQSQDEQQQLKLLWLGKLNEEQAMAILTGLGFCEQQIVLRHLTLLGTSFNYRNLTKQGQRRLDEFIPILLVAASQFKQADELVTRLLPFIEAIMRRSVYLVLLLENPKALQQLLTLCDASSWIAKQLTQYPVLLDELLVVERLYGPTNEKKLLAEMQAGLSRAPVTDLEQQMDCLRRFKHMQVLRIAAASLMQSLSTVQVCHALSDVADVILQQVLQIAWDDVCVQMKIRKSIEKTNFPFAVVTYGKLGARELGYDSDLDLVFLHAASDDTDSVFSSRFYARLAQRIIHLLNTPTAAGRLYQIDTRLRPSGNAGLLVSEVFSFSQYQLNEAWTWEHQAMVRARIVCGGDNIKQQFVEIRKKALTKVRTIHQLRDDILQMRLRIQQEKSAANSKDNLKTAAGGLIDIEFLIQYAVLRWAAKYPDLVAATDNAQFIQMLLQQGLVHNTEANLLIEAYQAYLTTYHQASLQNQSVIQLDESLQAYCHAVKQLWQKWLISNETK